MAKDKTAEEEKERFIDYYQRKWNKCTKASEMQQVKREFYSNKDIKYSEKTLDTIWTRIAKL